MNRRHLALAGAGAAAGVLGLVTAWRQQPRGEAAAPFWDQAFETLEGAPFALQSLRGRPLLLNFWATWCAPCVTELPMLDAFHREHAPRGWQVVGLAIDQPVPVRGFLARQPVRFAVALGGAGGIALARSLGNATGGLPFTAAFDGAGVMMGQKVGLLTLDDLANWARKAP